MKGVGVKRSAFEGAASGCSAWVVYGVVKKAPSISALLFHDPRMNMTAWQWRLTGMLMGAYAAAGPSLGRIGTGRAALSGWLKRIAWSAGPWEIYDLSSGPAESHNLCSSDDPRTVELSRWPAEWEAGAPPLNHGSQDLDDSVIERLKSFGYAQQRTRKSAVSRSRRAILRCAMGGAVAEAELCDPANAPNVERNLYWADDPRAVDLPRRLHAWVQSMPRENVRPGALDPATRERLKSLGCVQ